VTQTEFRDLVQSGAKFQKPSQQRPTSTTTHKVLRQDLIFNRAAYVFYTNCTTVFDRTHQRLIPYGKKTLNPVQEHMPNLHVHSTPTPTRNQRVNLVFKIPRKSLINPHTPPQMLSMGLFVRNLVDVKVSLISGCPTLR